jgi:hypothetical protein
MPFSRGISLILAPAWILLSSPSGCFPFVGPVRWITHARNANQIQARMPIKMVVRIKALPW